MADMPDGGSYLTEIQIRLSQAESNISRLVFDIQQLSEGLSQLDTLLDNETGGATSVEDVLSTYSTLNTQVDSIASNLTAITTRVESLEENEAETVDITDLEAAVVTINGRLDDLDAAMAAVDTQVDGLVTSIANITTTLDTKASQTGLDAVAASVVTKANKSTKVQAAGLATGGGDLTLDRTIMVAKATAAEVDAGIIDHKAVTPASLMNVLKSIREIDTPVAGGTNMLNTRQWLAGTTGSQGNFMQLVTGATASNSIKLEVGPLNTIEPVWTATTLSGAVGSVNDINGGFEVTVNEQSTDFNPKHSYRLSMFIKQASQNGGLVFACENSVFNLAGESVVESRFISDFALPELNKWYLIVGMVYGSSYTGTTDDLSGMYDVTTGERILVGNAFKSRPGAGTQKLRIFRHNANISNAKFSIARPRFDVITGEEPPIANLFGVASDVTKVETSTLITTSGLAQGGGSLTQNRNIEVPIASAEEIIEGDVNTSAITPKGLSDAGVGFLPLATEFDVADMNSETTLVTPKALRGLKKATPEQVMDKALDDVFVTPASLQGVDLGSGGGGGGAGSMDIATQLEVETGTNNTKAVTPFALGGLKKAGPSDVATRVSSTLIVTPASLAGLTIPDAQKANPTQVGAMLSTSVLVTPSSLTGLPKATPEDVTEGTSNTLFVTPASLAEAPTGFASMMMMEEGTSEDTAISPMLFRSMKAELTEINDGIDDAKFVTPAGLAASDLSTAVENFNAGNDRDGSAIAAPVVATDGTAVDHTLNTDGSANVSFEWTWTGDNASIDGFMVFMHVGTTNTVHTFGSGEELVLMIPSDKRALIHPGVPADRFYSFAVRAYRIVDSDISVTGYIYSTLVGCTGTGENPYQPATEVAFDGDITGTIDGVPVGTVTQAFANFNDRNDRDGTAIVAPALSTTGACIDHTLNTDGSANISFEWTWPDVTNGDAADEATIDGFIVYYRLSDSDTAEYLFTNPSEEFTLYVEPSKRAIILPGIPADQYYSFGVRAYRIVDTDIDATGFIKSTLVTPTRAGEKPYQPASSIAYFGNIAGTVNNVDVATITNAVENFDNRNDRDGSAIAAPVVSTTGAAVDHILNNDSSCDISFEWSWTGDNADIDGFYVIYHISPASGTVPAYHSFDNPSVEIVQQVPADKRALFLTGVAADKFYSFAVQAYRIVDADVDSSGVIRSPLALCTHSSEIPYRPTENLAFVGELTGTIDGESQAYVADAARNFNNRNDRDGTAVTAPAIPSDGTAIDHILNADGSATLSFEWTYGGDEEDIDGFILYRDVRSTNEEVDFTTPASEMVFYLPANKRAIIVPGVPADKYYTFGIRSYRIVDNDVSTAASSPFPGMIVSSIILCTGTGEHPYRPASEVAFTGRITGTIGNTSYVDVEDTVANFNNRNDRLADAITLPTIASDGTAVDHTVNTDGSCNISFEWVWSGVEEDIDGFIFYHHVSGTNTEHTFASPSSEQAVLIPVDKRAVILTGQPTDLYHSFGIRAYRIVDADVAAGGQIRTVIVTPSGTGEKPYRPAANVAFNGDITGTVGGISVIEVTDAVQNFNLRNDRNGDAVVAPVIVNDGSAVSHLVNPDGSVTVTLSWTWAGDEEDIDGFIFYSNVGTANTEHTFSGANTESVLYLTADRRAARLVGVPASRYYTFGVRAYRIVDPDVNANGIIMSTLVKPTHASEIPYQPMTDTVLGGDDSGSGGVLVEDLVGAAADAADALALANTLDGTLADFADDSVITYIERLTIRRELGKNLAERTTLRAQGTALGVEDEMDDEEFAWTEMLAVFTSMTPNYTSSDTTSSPIDRAVMQTKVNDWQEALQALANAVAQYALWDNVGGANKPADGATANAFRGEWAEDVDYEVGDLVTLLGAAYIVTTAHTSLTGTPPPNANVTLLSQGSTAKSVTLSYNNQFVRFDASGTAKPATQTLSFTANLKNTTDTTATWTAQRFNASNSSLGTFTMGGSGNTRTVTETQFGNASYVRVTATATTDGVNDQVTIIRVQDGEATLNGYLTNEAITLGSDAAGTVYSYSTAAGQFRVYLGSLDVTASSAFTVATSSGATASIDADDGNYSVTDLSADVGSVTFEATYNSQTVQRVLTLSKAKSGDVGVAGYLSNESHTVAADETGVVSSFTGAGGTFHIIYGITDVTGTDTAFSVLSETGVDVSINASSGAYTISSMSADQGTATFRCVYSGVTPSINIDKVYSITKSRAGAAGTDGLTAKTVTMTADRQIITFNGADALDPATQLTTFAIGKQNTTNNVDWSVRDPANLSTSLTPLSTYLTVAGDTNSATMTEAQFVAALTAIGGGAQALIVRGSITDGTTFYDQMMLSKVTDGATAVSGYLTNEAQALAADANGTVASFAPATGTFKVHYGVTDITTGASTTFAVTGNVGCTGSINASTGVYSVTAMSADQATLTMTATTSSTYGSVVVTRTFTLAKSKGGAAGLTARSLNITASTQTIAYDGTTTIIPGQSVAFAAAKQNSVTDVAWTLKDASGTLLNASTYLTGGTGTRTNLIGSSESFATWWTLGAVTQTANATAGPNGISLATLVIPTATNNAHNVYRNAFGTGAVGNTVTVSVFAKAGGYDWLQFSFPSLSANRVSFNVTTGATGTVGAGWTGATITSYGNGWYRCSATATSIAATSSTNGFMVSSADNQATFTGNGTSGIYLWGAQFAVESAVGPYIPTSGGVSTTAVLGDALTMSGANFNTARGSSEGIIVTGNLTDGAVLTDPLSVLKVQAGQNAISGFLTNEAHTLSADLSGNVADFGGATGAFKVFYGLQDVSTGAGTIYSVTTQTGCTGTINSSTGTYSVSAMTADTATLTVQAVTTGTFGGGTIQKVFTLSKAKQGATGATAKEVTITTSRQHILFDGLGAVNPSSQHIQFTATRTNTSQPVNWTITKLDGTPTDLVAASNYFTTAQGGATPTSTGTDVFMSPTQFNSARGSTLGVIVRAEVVDGSTLFDTISIVRVQAGANAVTGYLTNEAQMLTADNAGVVSDFSAAAGAFKVFYGATDLSTGQGTTYALGSATGCTGSINASTGAYSVTAMSTDTATISFTATTSSTYGSVATTKVFALAKSKAGSAGAPGAGAVLLTVISDRQSITYDNNTATPSTQTTTFSVNKVNTGANVVNWTLTNLEGTAITPVASYLSAATGDTVTMTAANFNAARGSSNGIVAIASVTVNSVTYTDKISLVRINSGTTNVIGYLTNESITLAADVSGNVGSFASATGTFKVFHGSTDITTGVSTSYALGTATGCTGSINASSGVYSITAMSTDNATISFTATTTSTYGSVVVTKVCALAKSKTGSAGSAGPGAKTLMVISDRQSVNFTSNAPNPSSQTTTFTAQKQNTSNTVAWTIADTLGNALSTSYLSATSGDTTTLTAANFATAIATNSANGVVVTGTVVDGSTLTDKISIVKVSDGSTGSPGPAAKSIDLVSTHSTFAYNSSGTPATQTTTYSVTKQNTSNATVFNAYKMDGTSVLSGTAAMVASNTYFSGSGDTLTQTQAQFNAFISAFSTTGVIVEAVVTDGSALTDRVSVTKVSDGASGALLTLVPDKTSFNYIDGALNPGTQTANFTAVLSNMTGTVSWTTSPNIKTGSGSTFTINQTEFNGASNQEVIVTATVGGVSDTVSLKRNDKFSPGYLANVDATMNDTASARAQLEDMDDGNKITKKEKKVLKRIIQAIYKEYPLLNTKATALGITTELTAYQAAYSALNTYLTTTTTLTNYSVTTNIVGATFDTKFDDYYDAQAALISAMHQKASTTADWSSVGSRPTHLTDNRITNALDSSGDFLRALTLGVLNSSNVLRRTGGGLYSGDTNATYGAQWGSNITAQPTLSEFIDEFDYADTAAAQVVWTFDTPANISIVTTTDSGGRALNIGDNSGNDMCFGYFGEFMPYIPSHTYEVTWDIEFLTSGASATTYLGVEGVDRGGNQLSTNWIALSGNTNNSLAGRQTIKGYCKGTAATASAGPSSNPDAPSALPDGTSYGFGLGGTVKIRPCFAANYNAQPGRVRIHSVSMRRLPDFTAVINRPANIRNLTGSENIRNNDISIIGGILSGIGTGGVNVDNNYQQWSQVSGSGRPADNATVNNLSYSASAPSSPNNGDIWVDTSVNPAITRIRVSGAWQIAANYATNTNQLTDGAGLGTTANWGNVASRPTELTDGRIAAGFDSSGDLIRNIPASRLDSSNVLRRTGGGLFSGDTNATYGADLNVNVANRTMDYMLDGSTYGRIRAAQLSGGNHKLTVAGSGTRVGDQRNMPAMSAMNLSYKWTSAISYTATTTSATISVAAATVPIGSVNISYNAMSVGTTGTSGTTVTYYLYFDDANYSGGSNTLVATTNGNLIYQNDGRVYVGSVAVYYPTSGGGSGGGEGGGGGYCVATDSWVETMDDGFKRAEEIVAGDMLRCLTDDLTDWEWAPVLSNGTKPQPSVRLTSASGAQVVCSESTPITLRDGSAIAPWAVRGHELPVWLNNELVWEPCYAELIGERDVAYISLGGLVYAAGVTQEAQIFTHNPTNPKP